MSWVRDLSSVGDGQAVWGWTWFSPGDPRHGTFAGGDSMPRAAPNAQSAPNEQEKIEQGHQQLWDSLPGASAQQKISASIAQGYGSLADWAAQRGLITQRDLMVNSDYVGAATAAQQRAADNDSPLGQVGGAISSVLDPITRVTALEGVNELDPLRNVFPTFLNQDVHNAAAISGAGQLALGGAAAAGAPESIADSYMLAQAPGSVMTDVVPGLLGADVGTSIGTGVMEAGGAAAGSAANVPLAPLFTGGTPQTPANAPSTAPAPAPTPEELPVPESGSAAGGAGAAAGGVALRDALQAAAAGTALLSVLDGGGAGSESMDLGGELEESEEQRQARIQASINAVNSAFSGFDDPYYSSIADAYRNYAMPQFGEQTKEARRRLPMTVPHTQSSAYNRKAAGLESDILRQESQIGSEALNQANRRRGEIDMTKSELLNLASSSAPTETVAQQASSRAGQFAAPPEFSPLADLFEKYTADAANFAVLNRSKPTAQVVRPLTFSHSPSRSQRIIA